MLKEADKAKDKFFALKGKVKPKGWKEEKEEEKKEESKEKEKTEKQSKSEVNEDEL